MSASKNPRLLVIVNVFNPDRGGGGAIFSDLCYGLASRGYKVTVRCAYPYYPEWRDKSGKNGLEISRYEENGVSVERYGIYIPKNPRSLFQRLIYEASFFFSLLRSLKNGSDFDIVMTYCPLVGAVAFAALNKLCHKKPLWLNVQDLSADAAAASGIARGKLIPKVLRGIQSVMFNTADVWSSISPVMVSRLETIRKHNQQLLYLPNWLNASMADEIHKRQSEYNESTHLPVRLLYAGNIGGKQDLQQFCKILSRSSLEFEFNIRGNGTEAKALESWIRQNGDKRFTFGPFLSEPEFAEALYDTDLFVITEKTNSGGSFIPCKMIAGISSGTPILAICDMESPLGCEVRENNLGPWFSWDDTSGVMNLLDSLSEKSVNLAQWQHNARQRARFYERDRVLDQFDTEIKNVCMNAKPQSI